MAGVAVDSNMRFRVRNLLIAAARRAGSLELAVLLLVALGAVLGWATLIEAAEGRESAQWRVYRTDGFVALFVLLAVNILASTAVRFPWGWRRSGFVMTHAGLLVLLSGAIWTFLYGAEGQIVLRERESTDRFSVSDRCQFTIQWPQLESGHGGLPLAFTFSPGPRDWPNGKVVDFGRFGPVALKVLRFYRHARVEERWVEDSQAGDAALHLALLGPDGRTIPEQWLVSEPFGGSTRLGPVQFEFHTTSTDSLARDFLYPPDLTNEPDGVLSVHCQGNAQRIAVRANQGKRIPLADGKTSIEIVQYLPDAAPIANGRFVSRSNETRNPLLELNVHLPNHRAPLRQIAFAVMPLLKLDAVHGEKYPVQFWYHHPGVRAESGVQFLQTPDGKLYGRAGHEGSYVPLGEVQRLQPVEIGAGFRVVVNAHLPHARREVQFQSVAKASSDIRDEEPAAFVELTTDSAAERLWLQRNHSEHGLQLLPTSRGPVSLKLETERLPLGFSLQLLRFHHDLNPGGRGDAAFASTVRLVDEEAGIDREFEIGMNAPLSYGKYSIYQSSFQEPPSGAAISELSVAYVPGRFLVYLGSGMVCLGIVAMFCLKHEYKRAWQDVRDRRRYDATNDIAVPMRRRMARSYAALWRCLIAVPAVGLVASAASASDHSAPAWDWEQWRALPVQDGGRYKPFDTLAWETLRVLANRARFEEPDGGVRLEPVAVYLAMLFDWQGWDQPDTSRADEPGNFYAHHRPDQWDRAPLLRVDYLALRTAIGLAHDRAYVSPLELSQADMSDPRTNRKQNFLAWAEQARLRDAPSLSTLERQGLALAGNFWAYREHRMGRRLATLPVKDDSHDTWMSVADLMRSAERAPPTDSYVQQAKTEFLEMRAAYRQDDPARFNAAATRWIATLRTMRPMFGEVPDEQTIKLEVAYNQWKPFRFAWVCALGAAIGALLSSGTGWKPCYIAAVTLFLASLVAILAGFTLRVGISGRAPVANMYESVVYLALGVTVLGLILEGIHHRGLALGAAAMLSTFALLLADSCPVILDSSLHPLQPVLRNNYWLVTHVMTITASYAAFALALGIGNVTLGHYIFGPRRRDAIAALTRINYGAIQIGVVLLAVGTMLGGIWADYSWGRFWGWDPKEVWALIALLGYVAVLHARYLGWIQELGLATMSVVCFALVIMAWYGVNFVLGAGLHSYGFGDGGSTYVVTAVAAQFIFVAAAVGAATMRDVAGSPSPSHTRPLQG